MLFVADDENKIKRILTGFLNAKKNPAIFAVKNKLDSECL